MASINKVIQEAAGLLNIEYRKKKNIAYGVFRGFTMVISPLVGSDGVAEVYFCASCNGESIKVSYLQGSRMPQKVAAKIQEFQVHLNVPIKGKKAAGVETLVNAVTAAVDALNTTGCVNCDAKGVIGETAIYSVGGERVLLTEESATATRSELEKKAEEYQQLRENPFLGFLGALLGSLAGVLVILLIARFGMVSAIGSSVMGIGVTLGYKKFGKKITMVSGIFCALLAVGMNYAAFRLDATIDMYRAIQDTVWEMDFANCFVYVKRLYALADSLSVYNKNFWLMMIAGGVGACVPLLCAHADSKTQFEFYKY